MSERTIFDMSVLSNGSCQSMNDSSHLYRCGLAPGIKIRPRTSIPVRGPFGSVLFFIPVDYVFTVQRPGQHHDIIPLKTDSGFAMGCKDEECVFDNFEIVP